MCSMDLNNAIKLNRSISDDDEDQKKLESDFISESRKTSDSLLPSLSSPLDSKQLKGVDDKQFLWKASSDFKEKHTNTIAELPEENHDQNHAKGETSPVRAPQRILSRNNLLIRKLSPGHGRVKDSIARHHFHISNFLAASPGHDVSLSALNRTNEQSLDLTELFQPDDLQSTLQSSPSSTAAYIQHNTIVHNATTSVVEVAQPPEDGGNVNDNPESGNEKDLTFDKIRVRTHDVTDVEQNLDWEHRSNSESFASDDYEKRSFEKKKAQRKVSKQMVASIPDAASDNRPDDSAAEDSSLQTQRKHRAGSLAVLQPCNEASEEDFSSHVSGRSDRSTSSRVSFGDVRVRRHKITLGDHPCVSQGPPVALDWSYMSSQHFDLEDYELITGDRQKAQKISREEREELLRTKGVSDDSLSRIEFEVQEIKASRKAVKEDKKKEDDLLMYKLLSSTSLREARLTTRQIAAEAELASGKQQSQRNPTHLSDFQPTVAKDDVKQAARENEDEVLSSDGSRASTTTPVSRRWWISIQNLCCNKKLRRSSATRATPEAS
ncbi:hypothetical protein FisN_21Lh144 [Fistulifera solaris]|uniref:Uncharacterized protein n=1 Tax=Fistulifera solaris TaxID=1519565 RepID=A0A1Z5J915_FISSO|nr:hypothetical protein FisN_21Lh144 [Fistulifera solaris]|eukprot:GAX10446.1 hypothetical protein FisN_21Lh144 [Fistulifera solaris]